jgi:hypothetical protein
VTRVAVEDEQDRRDGFIGSHIAQAPADLGTAASSRDTAPLAISETAFRLSESRLPPGTMLGFGERHAIGRIVNLADPALLNGGPV